MQHKRSFKNLGSIISNDGKTIQDVENRVGTGRAATRALLNTIWNVNFEKETNRNFME